MIKRSLSIKTISRSKKSVRKFFMAFFNVQLYETNNVYLSSMLCFSFLFSILHLYSTFIVTYRQMKEKVTSSIPSWKNLRNPNEKNDNRERFSMDLPSSLIDEFKFILSK